MRKIKGKRGAKEKKIEMDYGYSIFTR